MKGVLALRKSALMAAMCMAVMCLPGYSEPTLEQVAERTRLLLQAIENNNVEQAKVCIKLGADVNAISKAYAFMSAIADGQKDMVELLIKAGADVKAKGYEGRTALMHAADKDTAELLIKAGADVNAKDDNGWTALMEAAYSGYKDVAELLIKSGADSRMAFAWAVKESRSDAVELLINAGANPNVTDSEGISALDYAILYGQNDIANLLRAAGAKE